MIWKFRVNLFISAILVTPSITHAAQCLVDGKWYPYTSSMCATDGRTNSNAEGSERSNAGVNSHQRSRKNVDTQRTRTNRRQARKSSSTEYFYCGFTNNDGTGKDYAKWGKGTDFKFNKAKNRWEWNTKHSNQYIYSDGKYRQIAKLPGFNNQSGICNSAMERIYKQEMEKLIRSYQ